MTETGETTSIVGVGGLTDTVSAKSVERIASELAARHRTLAVAESCTGGLIAKWLTDAPGASHFFAGGVVAYANGAKRKLLGVRRETLERYGAVSDETAREMLAGIRRLMKSDAAIAITGIAGPSGGSPNKPVGTVWYGASVDNDTIMRCERFDGSRTEVRERSAEAALRLLEELIEGEERE